jgi:hypothetical protein
MPLRQATANPVYDGLSVVQTTLSGATQLAAGDGFRGLGLLWATPHADNAGEVYLGTTSGVTTSSGAQLPKGVRTLLPFNTAEGLYVVGTDGDVVSVEAYK